MQARLGLHLSKYHIVGNHMSRLNCPTVGSAGTYYDLSRTLALDFLAII